MKVYIVIENYHTYTGEFEEILGIFSSRVKAEGAIEKDLGKEKYRRWRYTVMEKELDETD